MIFEKVGDVNSIYPYLCVYLAPNETEPFMEIGVAEDKTLKFTIYSFPRSIELTLDDWDRIKSEGQLFLPKALADDESH